ncbi:hypothetical protein [Clostridium oceanicum]|uniref:BclA C-terminal domain-containing protein n=1 Tax=Clostridium oceanicum TaxID=1543 RepID=A0ABN1JA60_9CLOT
MAGEINPPTSFTFTPPSSEITVNVEGLYRIIYTAEKGTNNGALQIYLDGNPVPGSTYTAPGNNEVIGIVDTLIDPGQVITLRNVDTNNDFRVQRAATFLNENNVAASIAIMRLS